MLARARRWSWIWVPLGALAVLRLAVGDTEGAAILFGQASLAWAVGVFLSPGRRSLYLICSILLWTMLVIILAERALAPLMWFPEGGAGLQRTARSLLFGELTGRMAWRWRVADGADEAVLTFEAQIARGQTGYSWRRSDSRIEVVPIGTTKGAVRATFSDGGDPYLMRTINLAHSAAGERLRARIEIRSDVPIPPGACRGLWLQVRGEGGGGACSSSSIGTAWRTQEIIWRVPADATSSVIRLVVGNLDGSRVEIRGATLERWDGDTWVPLGPLLPSVPSLSLGWGRHPPTQIRGEGLLLTDDWRRFSFSLNAGESIEHDLAAALDVPSGMVVQVRNTELVAFRDGAPVGVQPTASARVRRSQRLWFSHPNLASHSTLALGTVALATATGIFSSTFALVPTFAISFATGSRAALAGALLATGLALIFAVGRRRRNLVIVSILMMGLVAVVGVDLVGQSATPNPTSRSEIWSEALLALVEHPWLGIGSAPDDFARHWRVHYSGSSTEPIAHAHNFWLALGAAAGVPGLGVALWISLALLIQACRGSASRSLIALLPILAANIVDYTFFFSWVLLPLIAALNALSVPSDMKRSGPRSLSYR